MQQTARDMVVSPGGLGKEGGLEREGGVMVGRAGGCSEGGAEGGVMTVPPAEGVGGPSCLEKTRDGDDVALMKR